MLSSEPGLGLPGTCQGAEGCFLSPTGNNFPGHGSPGLPIPRFQESSHVCDSGTVVGHVEFPLQIPCLPAAAIFLRGTILIVSRKKGPV